jgi:hypothetical protein
MDEIDELRNLVDPNADDFIDRLVEWAERFQQIDEQDVVADSAPTPAVADDEPIDTEEDITIETPKPVVPKSFTNNEEIDPELVKLLRMTQVVGKFASTLSLRPIKVELVGNDHNAPDAPAWSDSDNIWFKRKDLGDISKPETVTSIKGLSLHEIAHILLTPRAGSNLAKDVQRAKIWRAFNALEDQRIEMMMTKRFGNVADWLTATISQFIINDPKTHSVAFPLLYGRKYLPQQLRDQVTKLYEQPQNVVELASLIDRYIVLNLADPKNYSTAFDIIKRYDELVGQLESANPDAPWLPQGGWDRVGDPNGHNHRKGGEWKSSKSKPMDKAQQEKLAERIAQSIANQAPPTPGDGNDSNQSAGDNNGDQSSDNATPANAAGTGGGDPDLVESARKIYDDILKVKAKEIANTVKQYNADADLTSKEIGKPKKLTSRNEAIGADAISASRSFANELERLRADHDPGWNRRVEQGKLNVQRYVTGCEVDEAFDEWDIGREDAVDIECVIMLDVSPSMGDAIRGAYESMWAIKRAMDKVNASTTVLAFSHESFVLYGADERAGSLMKYGGIGGGTAPLESLKYGKYILAESKRAIKIAIVITDGVWSETNECDDILRELRRGGVLTALAFVEGGGWWSPEKIDSHGCEVAVNITDISDLFNLGRHMVKAGVARNLGNA